jgi:hypothetical protein
MRSAVRNERPGAPLPAGRVRARRRASQKHPCDGNAHPPDALSGLLANCARQLRGHLVAEDDEAVAFGLLALLVLFVSLDTHIRLFCAATTRHRAHRVRRGAWGGIAACRTARGAAAAAQQTAAAGASTTPAQPAQRPHLAQLPKLAEAPAQRICGHGKRARVSLRRRERGGAIAA